MLPTGVVTVIAVLPILPVAQSLLMMAGLLGMSLLAAVSMLRQPRIWWQGVQLVWRQKWGLLIVVGALALAGQGLSAWLRLNPAKNTPPNQPPIADWPHRGGLQRLGTQGDQQGPDQGGLMWTAETLQAFYSSPAMSGENLIAIGTHGVQGRLFCWEPNQGRLVWTASPRGFRGGVSSPVIANGMLFCGEGFHDTSDAHLYCFNLQPGREGELLWKFPTAGHVECTPVFDAGRLYVNAGDDGIYCLETGLGLPPEKRMLWHRSGSQYPDAETSLAVHAGRVYFGLGQGGNALCILDADTGNEIERIPFAYPVFGVPAIAGDRLYVGSGNGTLVHSAAQPGGQVCCINLRTLATDWVFDVPDAVMGAIASDGNDLYFGSAEGTLHWLNTDGQEQGRWSTSSRMVTDPAVTRNFVYVVTADGAITALGRKGFRPAWSNQLGTAGLYLSSPVVAHGSLYVGTPENGFVRVGRSTQYPAGNWAGLERSGHPQSDRSELPAAGQLLWSELPEGFEQGTIRPVAISEEWLVSICESPLSRELLVLKLQNGAPPRVVHRLPLSGPGVHSVAGSDSQLAFVDNAASGRLLNVLSLATGQTELQHPLDVAGDIALCMFQHTILLQDRPDHLTRLSRDGTQLWSVSLGPMEHSVAVSGEIVVAVVRKPPSLFALDLPTGTILWQQKLDSIPAGAPTIEGDEILLATTAGLERRSLLTGDVIPGSRRSRAVLPDNVPFELTARNGSILLTPTEIIALWPQPSSDSQIKWFELAGDDRFVAEPLLFHGRIYTATRRLGLVCLGADGP